jgi:uncharacterized membrane protein
METLLDTIMGFIFSSLPMLHFIIFLLIAAKALHFVMNRRPYWRVYQWVHFDNVYITHSRTRKEVLTKQSQNKQTQIIAVLLLIDVIFSTLQILISVN